MVAVFLANVYHVAFEVGVKILENGSRRLAVEKWLAVESHSIGFRGGEEFLRDFLLVAAEHMQRRDAAFNEAAKHGAVFANRGH